MNTCERCFVRQLLINNPVFAGKPEASSCDVDQFHCSNGKCIPDWWRCNSMDECGDNSDEELCVDSPFSFQPCSLNQFPCLSRYTRIYTCLPHSLRCDGSIDCQVTNQFTQTRPTPDSHQTHTRLAPDSDAIPQLRPAECWL